MRRETQRVLMLVENMSVPADPRVWHEAQTLHENGFAVTIISPKGTTRDRESYVRIDDISIYRYDLPITSGIYGYMKEYSIALLMTFWLSLKVWLFSGIDILHAANPPDLFFLIGLFYRIFGVRYVYDQHDLAPEVFSVKFQGRMKPLYRLHVFFERCSYRTANVVITTNETQRKVAIKRGRCSPDKVFVVRNGPDLERFCPLSTEAEKMQRERYLLAYVGVMGTQDGVEYALDALDLLIHQRGRQDIALILIGDGERLPALQSLAHRLDITEHVTFTGWVTMQEMLHYLASADIGLSPDPSNELNDCSTMIKTMEYMAMRMPVVAFDLPETRYSAQDSALYAPPNNVEAFADQIEKLLADEALRHQLGETGRRRVEEVLCWEQNKKKLLQAYTWLLSTNYAPKQQSRTVTNE